MHFIMAIESDTYSAQELESIFLGLRQRVVITKFSPTVNEYVKSSNPDIILMGLTFRDKREFEFILELRKDVITHNIPILAMIPKEDPNFIANHNKLGFTDYMIKPLEKQPLLDRIQSLIDDYKSSESSKTRDNLTFVNVDRKSDRLLFQCRANLKRYVFPDFKNIFSPNFLKSIQAEQIVFDVRAVPELGKEEVEIFEKLIKIFSCEKIAFIAGRHMGAFIEHATNDEKMIVFMAPNEFEDYMKMEEQKIEDQKKKEKKGKTSNQQSAPVPVQETTASDKPEVNVAIENKSNTNPDSTISKTDKTEISN